MPLSLHAAYVPSALQMLGTATKLVETAKNWSADNNMSEREMISARLYEDMLPFSYQVKCVAEHTQGSVEGVRAGVYSPDLNPPPATFDALREKLAGATQFLQGLDKAELESFIDQPMRFEFKDRKLNFTADQFLLSFSQPNYYFHCSTAYGIMRSLGVPVGKADFTGRVRIRTS
ncbi:hypothetical protein HME9302_00638 [Alteripontixanthobacter maritimus]|uniref:DUF1993 domain-containing protein n=1 Tax=Alteripontixanthobacter maritimus TaxID=2161824 RepID=A0A369Q4U1_9SPHN|nr:DUF1993 domain-containing protein [Alteripontixanthobacter maritimus]RDC59450.1 hypothetical protein HME9302_00638 [Alteripontixanthobacter maritimus]